MTDRLESPVLDIIRRSRRRVLASRLAGALIDGLVFGLLACLAFGALAHWAGWGAAGWAVFFVLLFLALSGYVAYRVLAGTSLRAVAILLDEKLGYHDRISSALAFSRAGRQTPFMQAHLRETAAFLEDRLDDLLPMPRLGRGRALVLFLALALVALLPHSDRTWQQQRERRDRATRRVQDTRSLAREIEQLRREADLRGLKKLSKMLAQVEEDLDRRLDLVTPEDLQPPPPEKPKPSQTPGTTAKRKAEEEGLKPADEKVGTARPGQGIQLSNVATYQPVGKFDSFPEKAYTQVFAELDGALLDNQLTGAELANLAEHVDDAAGKIANFAFNTDMDLMGVEAKMSSKDAEDYAKSGRYKPMEAVQAALQYRSFAEFLKRYAAHLGEKSMGKARFELSEKANTGGEVFNVSAPPPKDGKYALRGVTEQPPGNLPRLQGTREQMSKVASQARSMSQKNQDGSHTGAAGAGAGASQRTGRVPAVLPRPEGGQYLPLEGKLGEGPAVIQVIDARGRRNISARRGEAISYREVFVHYARGAEAELSSEQVPLHMRDYIRDYFRSIRPDLDQPKD